jgi:nitrite reductase/ring-hydroxylating ferredoxin subunit/DMSO/TMAO reductase YedYZ heme-binding membrane subunit
MSTAHGYRAVGWNRQKRLYDSSLIGGVLLYLAVFVAAGLTLRPDATIETLLIRAFGTAAFLLLHLILSIGPLCRLNSRFLPLLYNRRHLGVTMFILALAHGAFALIQFHALGSLNPLVSVLTSNGRYMAAAQFPFQPLGLAALVILFLMAATSHDFWLANLTPPVWKALHMLVYVAYGLLVLHVALGVLQSENHPLLAGMLGLGLIWILGLHLVAGWREHRVDSAQSGSSPAADGFVEVCRVAEIPDNRARIVSLAGERVAVLKYDNKISAISNVCQHQNGPLGEGRVINGCITCPWHGFEYDPETGSSPPPFTEKVPTFRAKVVADRVLLQPQPQRPGTRIEAAALSEIGTSEEELLLMAPQQREGFYIGYHKRAQPAVGRRLKHLVLALLLASAALAALLAALQEPFGPGTFEYGVRRRFEGLIRERPFPVLLVSRPGRTASAVPEVSRYPLVDFGKWGAHDAVAGLDGQRVRLRGSLIFREDRTMIEIEPGSVEVFPSAPSEPTMGTLLEQLGRQTLRGEIVDSKCYLGVMKPAREKPHRACASLCIRGGIPPLLIVETATGERRHLFLTDESGRAINDRVLPFVAEPVEITGQVRREDDLWFLAADPRSIRRTSE